MHKNQCISLQRIIAQEGLSFIFDSDVDILAGDYIYDDLRFAPDEDAQQEQLSPQDVLSSLLRALLHWR